MSPTGVTVRRCSPPESSSSGGQSVDRNRGQKRVGSKAEKSEGRGWGEDGMGAPRDLVALFASTGLGQRLCT